MDKISLLTLAAAKNYTDLSVEGAGAIKGKNCQIQSIEEIEGGHRITFAWYNESEVLVTDTLDVMDGEDGAKGDTGNGIVKIEKTATSGLTDTYTITFTDGTTFDYDVVNGADGAVLSVNGKTGNVTLSTNDLVNDSGFIQNTVNNLVNYYLKSQIYTKTEVEDIVSAISTLSLSPVEQLPTTDISTTTIYLLPSSTQGVMDQYINLDGTASGWVKIGDTSIDLTDYVTSSDLTLALADYVTEAELSTYVVDADYVHTDNNYTDTDKAIVGGVTSALAGKADKSEIPEKTSELTNDSGFITNLVNDLANYYKKTETYTQTEVDALISAIVTLDIKVVATLPTTDISRTSIYLVPSADPQAQNVKDEYINLDGTSSGWELIGSTAIDLSDYVTDTDLATALADYTTTANLTTLLAGKQDTISDLATIRSGASAGASAYQKPATGIAKTDLASDVQTSLGKADSAIQDVSGKADKVLSATNGNFAGLDSNGNLTDSGKKASDFMASDGVEANPSGSATGSLSKLRIGTSIYSIEGGGTTIVQIPSVSGTSFTYDGTAQGAAITGLDTTHCTVVAGTGTTVTTVGDTTYVKATNAGSYSFSVELNDTSSMVWSDLTIADKTYSFTIAKASQTLTASKNSVSLTNAQPSDTVTISGQQTSLNVSSSDTGVATASESSGVVTITGVGTGTATVSVYAAETANYAQSNTVSISVDALFNITVNVTVYSAANDTVSFTDATGSKTVTTNSSGSGTVSVAIPAGGQNITFTSSVAKNPDNLSNAYSKTVNITSSTTAVYVMPDNVLYWYGYESYNLEDCTNANGWSRTGYTFTAPTRNTNYLAISSTNNNYNMVGTKNVISANTIHTITEGLTSGDGSNTYGLICVPSSITGKTFSSPPYAVSVNISQNVIAKNDMDTSSYSAFYTAVGSSFLKTSKLYAFWYE